MARRSDNPKNRGRPTPASLDWLKDADPEPARRADITAAPPAGPDGTWRPNYLPDANPAPGAGPFTNNGRPFTDPSPPAGNGVPGAGAAGTGALSRRAARAQREAQEAAGRTKQKAPLSPSAQSGQRGRARAAQPAAPAQADRTAQPAPTAQPTQVIQPQTPQAYRPAELNQPHARLQRNYPATPAGGFPPTYPPTPAGGFQHTSGPQLTPGGGFQQPPALQPTPANGFRQPTIGTPANGTQVLAEHPSTSLRERERDRGGRAQTPLPPADEEKPRRRGVAVWLTLIALLLALWSATAFIDSSDFILSSLATLSPVVTIFALPVIAIGVASKHLVPTAIAVAAAVLPWTLVAGYAAAGPGLTTVGKHTTLRVMSVDGAQGAASAKDIVQVARTYSADVVVVTGLTSDLAHDITVNGLNTLATAQWVKVPANGRNGTGVWSGPKIDNLTQITELSRPGVEGQIESGPDRIGITVVQLDGDPLHPGQSWYSDLTHLAKRRPATDHGFIVGDLNATPWQPAFRSLTSNGWRDAADIIGQGLRPTWPSWSALPIAPLDHVLVHGGVGVTSASTTTIGGTDHRALIVTLILPDTGGK